MVCVLAAACDSPTVPERFLRDVYDYRLIVSGDLMTLRWPTGSTINVMTLGGADATRAAALSAGVAHAIEVWNNALLYGEAELAETTSIESADVVVRYSLSDTPLDLGSCLPSGGLATTTFCLTEDGFNLEPFPLQGGAPSRVRFVVTVRSTALTADVLKLVTHEMGHVLGIAQHSPFSTDVMYTELPNSDAPNSRDRATLEVLYHTEPDITP
jgi:predicted Zn-dependent protease